MINAQEKETARYCMESALRNGADAARVSMSKSVLDKYTLLNGELDNISHAADRSVYIYLFVDGRYGTFSTNRLEKEELDDFISKAIAMTRLLSKDKYRRLPDPERTEKNALTGRELDLYDTSYETGTSEERMQKAYGLSIYDKHVRKEGYRLISEECEYSESIDDNYLIDSQGFEGRHTETMYYCFAEMTIQGDDGNRYSGFWWEASQKEADLAREECAHKALERAVRQMNPKKRRSGNYRMVVDNHVASRLVSPIISALNASSVQQKMSFLEDCQDRKVFSEGFTLMDMARTPGKSGSRLFDTEGVATVDSAIIENGTVKKYFVNTYMSEKTGIPATIEDISRPCILPYIEGRTLPDEEKEVSLQDILDKCSNGILVTGFNGGNSNPVTGDFSFGIEGFAFSRGRITHPVKEMLITGNIVTLWNNLIAAGSDYRKSARWQCGSLAFENVSFSA